MYHCEVIMEPVLALICLIMCVSLYNYMYAVGFPKIKQINRFH